MFVSMENEGGCVNMCYLGARGPAGISRDVKYSEMYERIMRGAMSIFGAEEDEILLGCDRNPPLELPCRVYVLLSNCSYSYLFRRNGKWVNWNMIDETRETRQEFRQNHPELYGKY